MHKNSLYDVLQAKCFLKINLSRAHTAVFSKNIQLVLVPWIRASMHGVRKLRLGGDYALQSTGAMTDCDSSDETYRSYSCSCRCDWIFLHYCTMMVLYTCRAKRTWMYCYRRLFYCSLNMIDHRRRIISYLLLHMIIIIVYKALTTRTI